MKRIILGALLWVGVSSQAVSELRAELRPDEIAVIDVQDSRESRAVAAYYVKERAIPAENVLHLEVAANTDLTRDDWDSKVRPAIRRWLSEGGRLEKLRCFVTVWDVPLKIAAATDIGETQRIIDYLKQERRDRLQQLNQFADALAQLSSGDERLPTLADDAGLEQVKTRLDAMFGKAQADIGKIEDKPRAAAALQQLQTIYFQSVGMSMMMQSLQRQLAAGTTGSNPQIRTEFDTLRGRVTGLREGRAALEGLPFSLEREPQLLAVLQLSDGLYGTIAWIDEQLDVLAKNETYASFDSELSLVAWPRYQLVRWQPNLLNYRYDQSALRQFKKTFMVSRLEGPSLKLTRQIIDQTLAVEKTGLQGKVYLDARGLANPNERAQAGSYADYDQALLQTADLIKNHTNLEVVLDTKQDLFQPGSAPDAALYCGWYSLAKYVDAFDWKPGAIAYHMASGEATTLRDPESQVWCKRLLEDGAAATLGPVNEPYITAFPRPNEFFACLLSGRYTLVEAYYRTAPFTSWTMTLIGDPLYSPFKNSPPLRMDKLEPGVRRILDGPEALLTLSEVPAATVPSETPAEPAAPPAEETDADGPDAEGTDANRPGTGS